VDLVLLRRLVVAEAAEAVVLVAIAVGTGRRVDGHLKRRAAGSRTLRIWIRDGGDGGPRVLPRLRSDGVVALRELPRLWGQRRPRLIGGDVLLQVGGDVLLRLDWRIARLGGDGGGDALLWLVGGSVLLRLDQRAARLVGGSVGDAPLGLIVNVVLQPRSSSVGEASFFIRLSTFFCLASKSKFAG